MEGLIASMEDEFQVLAAKVLANEATDAERACLRALLDERETLRNEFAAVETVWRTLRTAVPLTSALNAPATEIPPERLRQLQEKARAVAKARKAELRLEAERQQRLLAGRAPAWIWNWLQSRTGMASALISVALLVAVVVAVFVLNRPSDAPRSVAGPPAAYVLAERGRVEIRRDGRKTPAVVMALRPDDQVFLPPGSEASIITPERWSRFEGPRTVDVSDLHDEAAPVPSSGVNQTPEPLRVALFTPASQLRSAHPLVTTHRVGTIPLYSPRGATANLAPLILWKAEPGKSYDLRITDDLDDSTSPWTVSAVRPPVEFASVSGWSDRPLARDGLYRLRITESGRPMTASEYSFRTVPVKDGESGRATAGPLARALTILVSSPSRTGDAMALLLTLSSDQEDSELALRLKLMLFAQLGYQEDYETVAAALRLAR